MQVLSKRIERVVAPARLRAPARRVDHLGGEVAREVSGKGA
jgi:hypothetical protein